MSWMVGYLLLVTVTFAEAIRRHGPAGIVFGLALGVAYVPFYVVAWAIFSQS